MKRCLATFLALGAGMRLATADIPDTYQPPAAAKNQAATTNLPAKPAKTLRGAAATAQTLAQMQAELDQLTKSNHDLLDLLKQQQSVLEDMQYDRRLQSRQIGVLEDRLEEALNDKHQLEEKIDKLETQAATRPAVPTPPGDGERRRRGQSAAVGAHHRADHRDGEDAGFRSATRHASAGHLPSAGGHGQSARPASVAPALHHQGRR
jgi:hypothetical protein